MSYAITWDAGATAEIEFISPEEGQGNYRLRYTPPYRTTLRSPVDALMVGPQELQNSKDKLQRFAESIHLVDGRGAGAEGGAREALPLDQLKAIGLELFEFMLPHHVRADLDDETFVELALDESLTSLPWEVMYDGEEFLSHRHAIGRFITLRSPLAANARRGRIPSELDDLKVLVVGVPRPTPGPGGRVYEPLPAVEPEVREIVETLADAGVQPTLLLDDDATYDNVRAELRKPYHIVHYSGHAEFDDQHPNRSALVLYDSKLTTGATMASFADHPAVLCFVNGCETSRPDEPVGEGGPRATWENRYNNYGLARSFLETGTYLLGSRWRLEDTAARTFARSFYEGFLGEALPVGKAIVAARRAMVEGGDDSCAWASYIYYGDPRIGIRRHGVAAPPMAAGPVGEDHPDRAPDLATLRDLAARYEAKRAEMEPGYLRTNELSAIGGEATSRARNSGATVAVDELYAESEGGRIIALAQIKGAPSPDHLDAVQQSIQNPLTNFEQYLALEAARPLVGVLDAVGAEALRDTLEMVVENEDFYGSSRFPLANELLTNLVQRAGDDQIALA